MIVVIKIFRDRIFCFLHASRISHYIDAQKYRFHRMSAFKNDFHDIGLVFWVCTAVIQLNRMKTHFFPEPVRVEIHRHGRTKNHAVILHMLCHTRILAQLIVHQIGKILKRRVIVKKRIYINNKCNNSKKHNNNR